MVYLFYELSNIFTVYLERLFYILNSEDTVRLNKYFLINGFSYHIIQMKIKNGAEIFEYYVH